MLVYRSLIAVFAVFILSASAFSAPKLPLVRTAFNQTIGKINVNTAKAKDLLNVKGINPATARAIVTYRKKHGNFKSMDDLAKVGKLSKLTPDELKAIQDQLSI